MKLSTKGRYATRALLDLALHRNGEPVALKDIAQRQQISVRYLEHLMAPLIAAGIARSVRGAKGGVLLVKAPEEVKLSEVINLLESSIAPVECVDKPELCARSSSCVTRDVWSDLKKAMDAVLDSVTLRDLIEREGQRQRETLVPLMYTI
jgi:Rrf2 family cysteine metabolism transcriptional repressor